MVNTIINHVSASVVLHECNKWKGNLGGIKRCNGEATMKWVIYYYLFYLLLTEWIIYNCFMCKQARITLLIINYPEHYYNLHTFLLYNST